MDNPFAATAENPPEKPVDISPPENPQTAQTPERPANELFSEAETAPKTSLLETIRRAGARVVQSRGLVFRKGSGRPRKDGLPGKGDEIIDGQVPGPEMANRVPGAPGVPDAVVSLARRSIVAAVKAVQWFAKKVVEIKADSAGLDSGFIEKSLSACEPEKGAVEDFQQSLDAVLRKHNFRPQNDEEWALVIDAGRLAAPYLLLIQTLNAEIARRRAEREALEKKETKHATE